MKEKSAIRYNIIKLVIYTVLAILVFVFRETLVENLKYFIGALMLMYAFEEILFILLHDIKHIMHESKTYLGLIELIMGFVLLFANLTLENVCVIWATWSILRESIEIKEIFTEIKKLAPKIISGLESIVVIVFSIMLIFEPGEHHAMIHLYLLLIELIVAPLTPLLDELLSKKDEKQNG